MKPAPLRKPQPWFWIVRVALSTAAVVAWGAEHPQAGVWQLVLVCFIVIIALEGLRYGYQHEQDRIVRRRNGRVSCTITAYRSRQDSRQGKVIRVVSTQDTSAQPATGIPIVPAQLTRMRDRRMLSREDLAERTGEVLFDRAAFTRVLSGDAPATPQMARALWTALGCRPQSLVSGLPEMARADAPLWLRRNPGWSLDTDAVKAQRVVRGWPEQELADAVARLWFSRDMINKIERGERRPRARTLRAFCQVLRCRPEQLMAGSKPLPDGATSMHRELLDYNKAMRAWADERGISYRHPGTGRISYAKVRPLYEAHLASQRDEKIAS